jgi:hypothetical protein
LLLLLFRCLVPAVLEIITMISSNYRVLDSFAGLLCLDNFQFDVVPWHDFDAIGVPIK